MKKLAKIIIAVIIIILLFTIWLFFNILRTGALDSAQKADAIAVLGAAQYAGKPSPVFEARLNHAAKLYKQKFAPFIITTGGIYSDASPTGRQESFSEGEVGKKYLISLGIPEEKIIAETSSLTTMQNLNRVAEISEKKGFKKLIIVSDPFHMYRSLRIARSYELDALPSPTRTSPILKNSWEEFKFTVRELGLVILNFLFGI
ncbi:MAG: YdcF family protein [Patescibacteria group bacterium]